MAQTTPLNIGQEDRQLDVRWLELLPKIIGDIAERAMISVHAGLQQRTVWNATSQSLLSSEK
ncbi:hypothetical protein [Bradyrhizobium sp. WSM2254]|uniref:hypothetical protein n=1 Tax=Bradyrhizobium sp. WSM2254 TaxID=1188263 RepID=UPI0006767A19|nr:hypothetical protein [Bradyrhizobium sp. WSM2254]